MATLTTEPEPTSAQKETTALLPSCLSQIGAALGEAADVGCGPLSEAELRTCLDAAWRAKAGIDEVFARLVVEAEQRGLPVDDGASSTRAWLAWKWRMSQRCAGAVVASTAALSPRVAATGSAWADGEVSAEQAGVIASAIGGMSGDVDDVRCRRAEAILIDRAHELTFRELRVLANRVVEVVDPDGADARIGAALEAEEKQAMQLTSLRRYRRGDGTTTLTGRVPDLHADLLYRVLGTLAAPRRVRTNRGDTDIAAAASSDAAASSNPDTGTGIGPGPGGGSVFDRDGDHCDAEVGPVSAAQRYGRALCELIEHLPTDGLPAQGAVTATLVVTVDQDRLASGLGEALLDTGGRISAGTARRLACNARLLPMVLGGDSVLLDQGRSRRLFDRHQRIALTVRDRGCIWPGCDRPPAWTEAHHVVAWSRGGATDLGNGCLLCSFHHHLLHKGDWAVRMAVDGIPEVVPPQRIDPRRTPIRHQRFGPPPSRVFSGPAP
jgi:hypothetical protein